jgi:alkylated DNA nucleotide flippase Atl1
MRISVAGLMLSIALAFVVTPGAEARDRINDSPHLRPATQAEATFVTNAQSMSQTVRDLARTLEQGNVVTYIHLARMQQGQPTSMLRFAGHSKLQRFVVVTIGSDLPNDRQIALLAHELQHVAELTRMPWVSSQADFRSLLALIGWRDATQASGYETSAALAAERQATRGLATAGSARP